MFALIKRVLDLAGSFSPAARRSLTWGMVCNILKAFFMAGMLGAVFWALENRDHLDAVVALQCLGILAVSVIGQYVFQYLVDITMDAQGFHIFRDLRLRVGDRLKAAPMGYFSEQRLSAVTTTLTTTVHQLEEFMTICLTGLTGGVAMAVERIVRAIVRDEHSVLPVSNLLQGQYGIDGLCMSIPAVVGRNGVEDTLEIPLSPAEREALRDSAATLRGVVDSLEL